MLLQPTSPIRNINEINSAIEFYRKNNLQSLLAFVKCESPYECIEFF